MSFTASHKVENEPFNYSIPGVVAFESVPAPLVSGKLFQETGNDPLTLMCRIILFIPFDETTNRLPISLLPTQNNGPTGESFKFELVYTGAPLTGVTTFHIVYYDYKYTDLDPKLFPNKKIVIRTEIKYTDPETSRGTVTTVQSATPPYVTL